MLRTMDLFSGIGGFSLGLRCAGGFRTVAYCEIDPYCQEVLKARMRDGSLDLAPICTDVRKLDGRPWAGRIDVICGGFPCQDISDAGKRAGVAGERSGLWSEIARLILEIRPRYVIVENVSALLSRGLGRVLGDLASSGYDAEWDCLPASAVGAPHQRDRAFVVAYPKGIPKRSRLCADQQAEERRGRSGDSGGSEGSPSNGDGQGEPQSERIFSEKWGRPSDDRWWSSEPAVGRMAYGVPNGVDRISSLGNAVVPQVVEWIGRRIMKAES